MGGGILRGAVALLCVGQAVLAWQFETPQIGYRWLACATNNVSGRTNTPGYSFDINASWDSEGHAAVFTRDGAIVPSTQNRVGYNPNSYARIGGGLPFGRDTANPNIQWSQTNVVPWTSPVDISLGGNTRKSEGTAGDSHWPSNSTGRVLTTNDVVVPVFLQPVHLVDWRQLPVSPVPHSLASQVWLHFEPWRGSATVPLGFSYRSSSNTFPNLTARWGGMWIYCITPFPDYDLGQAAVVAQYLVDYDDGRVPAYGYVYTRYYPAPGEVVAAWDHLWSNGGKLPALLFMTNTPPQ